MRTKWTMAAWDDEANGGTKRVRTSNELELLKEWEIWTHSAANPVEMI